MPTQLHHHPVRPFPRQPNHSEAQPCLQPGAPHRASGGAMAVTTLFLEYDASAVPAGGAEVVASPGGLVKAVGKDAAGHAFHDYALRQAGLLVDKQAVESEAAAAAAEDDGGGEAVDYGEPEGPWKSKGKKKKKKDGDKDDLYALVGLKKERWMASEKQIKDSYRKVALEMHPDKCGAATADEETKQTIEDRFKRIQEAYETLMDPQKRREYDSTDDFDDTLPSDCTAADFFKVFGPAFMRQSRWAINKPVPGLGNPDDDWEKVDAFYDYWFTFKSWREFPHPDEEDVESAECREHKRYIERENAKLRRKAEKDEVKRLKEFVENAFSRDPRVVRHKEEEKAAREAKKREKAAAANAAREAAEAAARAEEERRAEEAAQAAVAREAAKKDREKERKLMQKERKKLRTQSAKLPGVDDDHVEKLCQSLSLSDLQSLNGQLEAGDPGADLIKAGIRSLDSAAAAEEERKEAARLAEIQEKERLEQEKREATLKAWSEEELRMLEKACVKYPKGTAKRWEQVTMYVRTRSQAEVIEMVKVKLAQTTAAKTTQDTFQIRKKHAGNVQIKDEATHRLTSFSDVEVNIKGAAAEALMNPAAYQTPQDDAAKQPAAAAPEPATPPQTADAGGPAAAEPAKAADVPAKAADVPAKAAAAPEAERAEAAADEGSGWSEVQSLALVKALKVFGKELGQERWVRISEAVPGKSKTECFKRFKELREGFRAKKEGTA
eukprot:jgi/Tetstr1/446084/TSEL_033685.t1